MSAGARAVLALAVAVLAGCSFGPRDDGLPPSGARDLGSVADAVPRNEPRSRYGNPRSYVVNGRRYYTLTSSRGYVARGIASWYGRKFHGRRTSNGEVYDMYAMTAAHRTLPLPTYLQVTNLRNGRRVVVRVNDRGPFHDERIIDLSYAAAYRLGIVAAGTGLVELRAIDPTRPVRVAAAAPAANPAAKLYLQAGAFAQFANARNLRARLAAVVGAAVAIDEGRSGSRRLYRVRVGPLATVDEVDRVAAVIKGLGFETPHVVVE